jgi:hypothetical protein
LDVSLPGARAMRCDVNPPLPKAPKIRMKIMGNNKLKKMAIGCLKIAMKLALVMAQKALDWLYDFAMKKISSKCI